jgi:8-oxo-dGTP pyrophosphatase MutT (NUDIX family)
MKPAADIASAKTAEGPAVQYAALPFQRGDEVRILLVTSRETGRWVIPKGWPMRGRKPYSAAAREALEEAGIEGRVDKQPIGFYRYDKRLANGVARRCTVQVFPLEVRRQRRHWREQSQRTARWFTVDEAADAVQEPELHDLIHVFGISLGETPRTDCGAALAEAFGKAAVFGGCGE